MVLISAWPSHKLTALDYLGEFSDPELVKQHLALGQAKELEQKEAELAGVSKALADLEGVSSFSIWTC